MDDESEKTINTYNEIVEQYYENTKDKEKSIKYLNKFAELLPKNSKILDVGCGPGRDVKLFSEKGFRVVGIDLAEKMIKFAKQLAPNAEFKVMDIRHLTFNDDTFDAIWCNTSLINLKKQDALKALEEMYRVLKPKGLLFVMFKQGSEEGLIKDKRYDEKEIYYTYYNENELKQKLEKAGFYIIKINVSSKEKRYPHIIAYCSK